MKPNDSEAFQVLERITRDWPKPMSDGKLISQVIWPITPWQSEYNLVRWATGAALGEEIELLPTPDNQRPVLLVQEPGILEPQD